MIMAGWIKLHRDIKNHWIYTEKRKFSKFEAWTDILLSVNHAQAKTIIKGKLITIERGESILSLDSWGMKWGWNKSAVNRFFDLLKKDGMIVLQNETVTTRLTVCNYASYQDERNAHETQTKRKRNASETQTKSIEEEQEEQQQEKEEKKFRKPTIEEIALYMEEKGMNNVAERFYNFYEAKGWMIGRNQIKNWKACVITWKDGNLKNTAPVQTKPIKYFNIEDYDK
jgi:DNA-binding transcriptional regulator YhcF (GntR family)